MHNENVKSKYHAIPKAYNHNYVQNKHGRC